MTADRKRSSKKKNPASPAPARKGLALYRAVFESSGIASAFIGEDGVFLLVNSRFEQVSGYPAAEIEGRMHWKDLVFPDDADRLMRYTRELLTREGIVPPACTFDLRDRNGQPVPMLLSIRAIPESKRVVISLVENATRKKLDEKLREAENRYRALVDEIPVGVFRNKVESPGRLLWGNPAVVKMYGYDSLADMNKHPLIDLYADPADRKRFLEEILKEGFIRNFCVRHKRKDGSLFMARLSARARKNRDNEIAWIDGIVEDLSHEIAAQDAQDPRVRLARAAFDSATGVSICTTDMAGTFTMVNRGLEEMLGYSSADLVDKETPLLFHSKPELLARGEELTKEAGYPITGMEILTFPVERGTPDEREWTWARHNGDPFHVLLTTSKLTDAAGRQLGYLFTAKEITAKREVEEAFRSSCLQMSGVIYNLPEATFAIDQDGNVIAWNRVMEDLTGITATDILGKGDYIYAIPFYGEKRPMLIDLLAATDAGLEEWGYCAIRRKGNAIIAETPTIDPDNNVRVISALAAPIFDGNGNRVGAIESVSDATSRRIREAVLEDSVQKFREILDNTGSATAIIDEDDTITYINPEFGRLFGYVRNEVEGKKKWTEFVVPEDLRRLREQWNRLVLQGSGDGPFRFEVRFIRWDGEVCNELLTVTRIPGTQK
ncbi:MAG: PAS domain S-box protein, partial [Methanomicrobiales archaeon]|nr:PAS domain S-box protein [Methanomicrobiales archaeon]